MFAPSLSAFRVERVIPLLKDPRAMKGKMVVPPEMMLGDIAVPELSDPFAE